MSALPLFQALWAEVEDMPYAIPSNVELSVIGGEELTGSVTFDHPAGTNITISLFSGSIPAWVTSSLVLPLGPIAPPQVLNFGGTAPTAGPGSHTGSPYSWTYAVTDGSRTAYVPVTLNVIKPASDDKSGGIPYGPTFAGETIASNFGG